MRSFEELFGRGNKAGSLIVYVYIYSVYLTGNYFRFLSHYLYRVITLSSHYLYQICIQKLQTVQISAHRVATGCVKMTFETFISTGVTDLLLKNRFPIQAM